MEKTLVDSNFIKEYFTPEKEKELEIAVEEIIKMGTVKEVNKKAMEDFNNNIVKDKKPKKATSKNTSKVDKEQIVNSVEKILLDNGFKKVQNDRVSVVLILTDAGNYELKVTAKKLENPTFIQQESGKDEVKNKICRILPENLKKSGLLEQNVIGVYYNDTLYGIKVTKKKK